MKNYKSYILSFIIGLIIGQTAIWLKIEYVSFKWWIFVLTSAIIFVLILGKINKTIRNRKLKS